MKKLALHWQILLGMVFGVLFAFILIQFTWGKDLIVDWVKPFGTIFINLLKLIAVPLILASSSARALIVTLRHSTSSIVLADANHIYV